MMWTEEERLAALRRHEILDTDPEPAFDDVVSLVRTICQTPIALVSLVDAERQWFKARLGVDATETCLSTSVCALAIRQRGVFVIEDLSADTRTAHMSLVTDAPHIRFYAGMPLVTADGMPLGSLCAIDLAPRSGGLNAQQAAALAALGRQVAAQIDLRSALGDRDRRLIEQQKREERAARDAEVLGTMLEAQRRVLEAGGDAAAALGALVEAALSAVKPADGVVVEVHAGDALVYQAAAGTSAGHTGMRVPIAHSLSGLAFEQRSTLVSADAWSDARAGSEIVRRLGIRSMIVVPLLRHGRPFGVLKVHAGEVDAFRSRHVLVAQMLAGLIAASFTENAETAALRLAHRAEENYRTIIDSAIDSAIISTDDAGIVTSWSRGGERIFGWTEQEMIGAPLARIFTPEDVAAGRPALELRKARAEGRAADERWHIRKDGTRFYANGAVTPLLGDGQSGFVKSLRDITDDHTTRQALDASRVRLELASRAARLGSFDFMPQTGELTWDDRCRELFGLRPGTPVAYEESFLAGLHPDDRADADAAVAAALDPAGAGRFEIDYRTVGLHDGVQRTVAAEGLALFEHGKPIRLIGTVRDVTADRKARAELRETEERLRYAVAATNDAVWDWDLRIDRVLWNDALSTAYGHRPDSVISTGAWWLEHIHPDDRERVSHSIHGLIGSPHSDWLEEYRFRRADGTHADVLDRGFVIRDEAGTPTRMIGAMLDLTDRKSIERALRSRADRLEVDVAKTAEERDRIWEASPDLLVVLDFAGIMQQANHAWTAILGYDADDLIGRPLIDLVHPDDVAITVRSLHDAAAGPLPTMENRYRHADGGYRWISWVAAPAGGRIYATGRHVTAEKDAAEMLRQTEEALRQAQKVEAVGQLTGGVAHDFNNFLTVIRGSVDLLKRPNLSAEKRERYITAISDTADRATRLTAQLLAFARRQTLQPQIFDAGDSVWSLGDMLGTLTGSRINLILRGCDGPCFVNADPSQFDTAIVNMAVNARDAMDGAGDLTMSVATAEIMPGTGDQPPVVGRFVTVAIADTGSGIAPDRLERIFEPFYTTKAVGHGTGLGLSQVFGFARQSNGGVLVDSVEGEGTVFTLYLPRAEPAGADEKDTGEERSRGLAPGACILVVEDNEEVGQFATQALAELGFHSVWAANAAEAIDRMEQGGNGFDVVFTDVIMPGDSGIVLAERIRERWPTIPIVLTSGYSDVLAQNGTGGYDLLQKPYSIERLADTLGRLGTRPADA